MYLLTQKDAQHKSHVITYYIQIQVKFEQKIVNTIMNWLRQTSSM
jgi:hypothetical protein